MHRFTVDCYNEDQWYDIIRECKRLFKNDWRGQRHVLKKLKNKNHQKPIKIWFEIPDNRFASYITLKYAQSSE
jgi:hypothetical protein